MMDFDDRLPACDLEDPASLDAWFGRNGIAQHVRKIVLAQCRELERAKAVATTTKTTEARLDDLSRDHDMYVEYVRFMAEGATLYSRAWLETQRVT